MGRKFIQHLSVVFRWFVLVKDLDFGPMGCFIPSSAFYLFVERWDGIQSTLPPRPEELMLQFEWMHQQWSETWRFLKMASSTVILVLLITCCEPFAWFDSLVCPFSNFTCNGPNNVSQKCSKLYWAIWIQHLHEKTYSVVLPLARLRSMTEESGSKEATKLSQKERHLGTSKLLN